MNNLKHLALILITAFIFSGCDNQDDRQVITIGLTSWEEDVAMSNVAKTILEENGYKVKFRHADIEPIFKYLLPKGKVDVFLDVWMPMTHKHYMEEYGDSFEILGTNYQNATTGLVVPDYVSINSIDELNNNKDKFKRKITGIDRGAGIMENTERAIEAYDLDFQLIPSTNFAMVTSLQKAIDDKDWIVVTGWAPHSIFSRFDLKTLKDPKNIFGGGEKIETVSRKGFSEDHPFVAEFFKNMRFSKDQMISLMGNIENAKHDFEGAEKWIDNHPDLVNKWLPEKKRDTVSGQ